MATIQTNALLPGLSGSIGSLVFKQVRGKTILSGKGSAPRRQSAQQRENRNKFRLASKYAKAAMLDVDKKAYYWSKAKKLKLPNAYTAALCDYMRNGEIKEINTRRYAGKVGDVIYIEACKKDFAVNKVTVELYNAKGVLLEYGMAIKTDAKAFMYKATVNTDNEGPVRVRVAISDYRTDSVVREVMAGSYPLKVNRS